MNNNSQSENLFEEDSLAIVSAKLRITEVLFNLIVKDCKFVDFVHEILVTTMKVIPCEAGSILEFDQKNECLFFRATIGQSSEEVSKFTIPMGKGVVGHVAESLQPYVQTMAETNDIHLKSIDEVVGFKTRNVAAVPILIRGRLFGVLELLNSLGDGGFTQEDMDLLTYAAEKAAKAIEVRLMFARAMTAAHGSGNHSTGNTSGQAA